ncbi:stage V sporulation protein SpoVM [Clostridium cavendishii]
MKFVAIKLPKFLSCILRVFVKKEKK